MESRTRNILVVDDHPTNRKLLRAMLEAEGYGVFEAADGVEALALLERSEICALISDILMPRMDGYRLCLEVRKRQRHKTLSIIIYTSTYTSPGDEKCALDSGADKYIRKPAPAQTILDALHGLLKNPRVRPNQSAYSPEELEVMKEYSEALIRKLEEKNEELEQARQEILKINRELENRVRERTAQLEDANTELEAFSRSVAHDLRNPLSVILGFAHLLETNCGHKLEEGETKYIRKIVESSGRMEDMIVNLLNLSRGTHAEIHRAEVNLSVMAREIVNKCQDGSPTRIVEVVIKPDIRADADAQLIWIALENLLGNAWKFTGKAPDARIEFGVEQRKGQPAYFVRDNGIGFDMAGADKLFGAFQRLQSSAEFPGTGIGLTTVQRIIWRHGGRVWAESVLGRGTTFYFTL